jgi:hypothetical protein
MELGQDHQLSASRHHPWQQASPTASQSHCHYYDIMSPCSYMVLLHYAKSKAFLLLLKENYKCYSCLVWLQSAVACRGLMLGFGHQHPVSIM